MLCSMAIQPRIVAKLRRPKKSPTSAHVTELMPSPHANSAANRTMCASEPSLYMSTRSPRAPSSTPAAPIRCFDRQSPSQPISGRVTTVKSAVSPTKNAAVGWSSPFHTRSGTRQPTGTTQYQLRPHQLRCGG